MEGDNNTQTVPMPSAGEEQNAPKATPEAMPQEPKPAPEEKPQDNAGGQEGSGM